MSSFIIGVLFAIGLCAAGSDGQWFPWGNVAGVALAGVSAFIGRACLKRG